MSQIQGVNNAQYSMSWLFSVQQAGTATAASPPPAQASNPSTASFDPFAAMLAPGTQQSDAGAAPPFSLDAMRALIAAQEQSSGLSGDQQKVFSKLDTDGDGKVTQSELEGGVGADNKTLADAVMSKLDTNGDGAIDQSEFAAKTKKSLHHHGHQGGPKGLDALLKATQGETPAASTTADSPVNAGTTQAQAQSNLIEQLIRLQA
jgi:hypothetical protein